MAPGMLQPGSVAHRIFSALAALSFVAGCSGDPDPQPPLEPVDERGPTGACKAVERSYEGATAEHHAPCTTLVYSTSPPVFGDHYPEWAAYTTYDFPLSLGFLVHDLEHGAVVIFYDCPEGCAGEVASAQAFIDALPADPRCSADVRVQVILVPRPGLGSRWAASAWGHSLNADCFDEEAFGGFYTRHHARAPENLCNQGTFFTSDPCR